MATRWFQLAQTPEMLPAPEMIKIVQVVPYLRGICEKSNGIGIAAKIQQQYTRRCTSSAEGISTAEVVMPSTPSAIDRSERATFVGSCLRVLHRVDSPSVRFSRGCSVIFSQNDCRPTYREPLVLTSKFHLINSGPFLRRIRRSPCSVIIREVGE